MKHLLRKPLLPLLLLAMIVFADCFLVSFREGILRDREQVENLYDNTLLTIELLPGENSGSRLRLPTHKKDFLEELAQVEHTLYVIECDALASDTPARLYGTNDLPRLVSHCSLAAPEGLSFSGGGAAIPCLVGTDLAAALALSPGDTLTVIPINSMGAYTDSAPHVPLTVLGIFSDPAFTMDSGIIVPEEIFLHGPKLLYNSDMMYDCFYRTYIMELDRAYNRDFEATEEAVEDILADRKQFELSSNYRTLRRVVGPLERKLAVQERLVVPLAVLFALAGGLRPSAGKKLHHGDLPAADLGRKAVGGIRPGHGGASAVADPLRRHGGGSCSLRCRKRQRCLGGGLRRRHLSALPSDRGSLYGALLPEKSHRSLSIQGG